MDDKNIQPLISIEKVPSAYFPCWSVARIPNVYDASISGAVPLTTPVVEFREVPGGRWPDMTLYWILPPSGSWNIVTISTKHLWGNVFTLFNVQFIMKLIQMHWQNQNIAVLFLIKIWQKKNPNKRNKKKTKQKNQKKNNQIKNKTKHRESYIWPSST